MNNIIKRTWNQNSMVIIEDLRGLAFQEEANGHTFEISGVDQSGQAVALSGTPSGVMLRSDNQDVALTCSVSDGKVYATLPANAYAVPGRFGLTIFLTSDSQTMAIYAAVGTVKKTSSGTVAPPAGSDVVDLVNAIAAAVATIPSSYTDMMAAMAPTYSNTALYAVGQYAWYEGVLKRCIVPITTAESYTAAHWTNANLGGDVTDLKSALDLIHNETYRVYPGTTNKITIVPNGTSFDITIPSAMYMQEINNNKYYTKRIYAGKTPLSFTLPSDRFFAYDRMNDVFVIYTDQEMYTNRLDCVFLLWNQGGGLHGPWEMIYNYATSSATNKKLSYELCGILTGVSDTSLSIGSIIRYIDLSYSGSNFTFTVPKGTAFVDNRTGGITSALATDKTVTFGATTDYAIVYNKANGDIEAKRFSNYNAVTTSDPDKYLLIAVLNANNPKGTVLSINATYTFNGCLPGLESIYNAISNIKYLFNFQFGDVNGSTGAYSAENVRRMTTPEIYCFDYDIVIPKQDGYAGCFLNRYADASGTSPVTNIGQININDDYVIRAGTYFRLLYYKVGDTSNLYGDPRNNPVYNSIKIYRRSEIELLVKGGSLQNLFYLNQNVRSVAHRGLSRVAPENTLPAFIEARRAGFEWVETDVSWTHDGVPVLLHDTTIDRTSDGTGNIADLDYDDIKNLDFGSWFSSAYAGTKIPKLDEFLQLCRKIGLKARLDIRSHTTQQLVDACKMVVRNGMIDNVEFVGGEVSTINSVIPHTRIILNIASVDSQAITNALAIKSAGNEVNITTQTINDTVVGLCADALIPLEYWTAGTEAAILNLDPYVTVVTTEGQIAGDVLYRSVIS